MPGALPGALGGVDAKAVIAEPCGGAEDRLVDPEVEPSGRDGATAAQLVGQLGASQLEHLHRLRAGIETPRNPDATPVIELVGQRQTVPAPCPGLETGPVAALDGPSLAAGVDTVEGRPHRAQQSRLACLVPAGDDRHARMQLFGEVVEASEAGDVQSLENHRNPISAPESAIRP